MAEFSLSDLYCMVLSLCKDYIIPSDVLIDNNTITKQLSLLASIN